MPERVARSHPPLVLIASSQEWHARSLESILGPHGYAVVRAYTGKQALERARSARPDLVIVDADLPDLDGIEVCRSLREDPPMSASTPILITGSGQPTRQQRLAALRAGAWDYLTLPFDGEELQLRLDAFIQAKFEADRAREESLLDELTGLYNIRGLARRARELGSQAFRHHEPFACVVLAPHVEGASDAAAAEAAVTAAVSHIAKTLRSSGRVADAIGRLGPTEFGVVAQGADAEGVVKLVQRLIQSLEAGALASGGVVPQFRVRAGYDAVPNYYEAPIEPEDMLVRATIAMRMSQGDAAGQWIRPFESRFTN
jgi:diguanylate cyclase (GGDEF)-like protein